MKTRRKDYGDCINKYQKIESHGDQISNLPDDVISNILSHLRTKDAVRTSVLSRSWEHRWTSIYNIDIQDDEIQDDDVTRFISAVDDILFTYKSRIMSFRLVCVREYDEYHLVKWISTLLRRDVQNLHIQARNWGGRVNLPRCLSRCTSLIELNLYFKCTLKVPTPNCFQNLKKMGLRDTNIHNEQSLHKSPLLLSFPVLEDLELTRCTWVNASIVEIRTPALLTFQSNNEDSDCQVKIYGPKLERVTNHGSLASFDIRAPSVSTVHLLEFAAHVVGSNTYAILKSFPLISRLAMNGCILKAFVQFKPVTPPIFGCLQTLIVLGEVEVKELMGFLQLTPILKTLFFYLSSSDVYDGEQVKPLPTCMISSLNVVGLIRFSGTEGDVAITKFILQKAKVLEVLFVPDSCMMEPLVTNLRSAIPTSSKCRLLKSSSLF